MYKRVIFILSFLLIVTVSLITVGGVLFIREKELSQKLRVINEQAIDEKDDYMLQQQYRHLELALNGTEIDKTIVLSDEKGNLLKVSDILNTTKLVLFFSESNCSECVNVEISNLRGMDSIIDFNDVLIMVKSISKRYVNQYRIINKLEYPIYEIKESPEGLFPEFTPLFFIIEKETFRINSVFAPSKYNIDLTTSYFKKIEKKYFH